MKKNKYPEWEKFEHYIQELLELDSTIASGAQYHDPGDATDNRYDSGFRIVADAKHTTGKTYPLERRWLVQQVKRFQEMGRRFVLPLRFGFDNRHPTVEKDEDFVILSLNDFAELYEFYQKSGKPSKVEWAEEESDWLYDLVAYGGVVEASNRMRLIELAKRLRSL